MEHDVDNQPSLDPPQPLRASERFQGRRIRNRASRNHRIEFKNYFDGSGIYGSGPTLVSSRYVYDGQNVIAEYSEIPPPVRQR